MPAGSWTVTTARRRRCRSTIPFKDGGYFVLEARGRGDDGRFAVTRDVVLRARRRLHGVAALRPQPHRAGARAPDLQARRHRAHHDPVAVGAGHRAGDDRARRHPQPPAVRADLDAAVDRRCRSREDDIPNVFVSVLLVKGRTNACAGRRRRRLAAKPTQRSRQAVVPPRLRRAAGRGSRQAADRRRSRPIARSTGRRPRPPCGVDVKDASGARHGQRGHALGGRLRRAVAHRLSARPTSRDRSTSASRSRCSTADNRQRIVARRVLTPKGGSEGGGGGEDAGRHAAAATSACWRSGSDRWSPAPTARPASTSRCRSR